MGLTKSDFFTDKQNKMSSMMKALGHPARIAIIDFLLKDNKCICGDIVQELPLAQPTISQHLKELKNAGLIKGNIEGNAICYCINKKTFMEFQKYLTGVFDKFDKQQNDCC
jgi:ArsR family transcriptional regulator